MTNRQKVVKGQKRLRLSSSVHKAVRKAIESDAKLFNCSLSFVQNTALADCYGIEIEEKYYLIERRKRAKNVVQFKRKRA